MLTLNPNHAKAADAISSAIREPGKYIGIITRAEALLSANKNQGIGLSFKSDSGETADYLDLYMGETDGKPWPGTNTVNAILCCLRVKQAPVGKVKFEKWDKEAKERKVIEADGYPDIQGKRIGLLLQKELSVYQGKEQQKLLIYGVFEAKTELTASEILNGATQPEKLSKMVQSLMARPVRDLRGNHATATPRAPGAFDNFDDDIPF